MEPSEIFAEVDWQTVDHSSYSYFLQSSAHLIDSLSKKQQQQQQQQPQPQQPSPFLFAHETPVNFLIQETALSMPISTTTTATATLAASTRPGTIAPTTHMVAAPTIPLCNQDSSFLTMHNHQLWSNQQQTQQQRSSLNPQVPTSTIMADSRLSQAMMLTDPYPCLERVPLSTMYPALQQQQQHQQQMPQQLSTKANLFQSQSCGQLSQSKIVYPCLLEEDSTVAVVPSSPVTDPLPAQLPLQSHSSLVSRPSGLVTPSTATLLGFPHLGRATTSSLASASAASTPSLDYNASLTSSPGVEYFSTRPGTVPNSFLGSSPSSVIPSPFFLRGLTTPIPTAIATNEPSPFPSPLPMTGTVTGLNIPPPLLTQASSFASASASTLTGFHLQLPTPVSARQQQQKHQGTQDSSALNLAQSPAFPSTACSFQAQYQSPYPSPLPTCALSASTLTPSWATLANQVQSASTLPYAPSPIPTSFDASSLSSPTPVTPSLPASGPPSPTPSLPSPSSPPPLPSPSGSKSLICVVCKNWYANNSTLRRHFRIHIFAKHPALSLLHPSPTASCSSSLSSAPPSSSLKWPRVKRVRSKQKPRPYENSSRVTDPSSVIVIESDTSLSECEGDDEDRSLAYDQDNVALVKAASEQYPQRELSKMEGYHPDLDPNCRKPECVGCNKAFARRDTAILHIDSQKQNWDELTWLLTKLLTLIDSATFLERRTLGSTLKEYRDLEEEEEEEDIGGGGGGGGTGGGRGRGKVPELLNDLDLFQFWSEFDASEFGGHSRRRRPCFTTRKRLPHPLRRVEKLWRTTLQMKGKDIQLYASPGNTQQRLCNIEKNNTPGEGEDEEDERMGGGEGWAETEEGLTTVAWRAMEISDLDQGSCSRRQNGYASQRDDSSSNGIERTNERGDYGWPNQESLAQMNTVTKLRWMKTVMVMPLCWEKRKVRMFGAYGKQEESVLQHL